MDYVLTFQGRTMAISQGMHYFFVVIMLVISAIVLIGIFREVNDGDVNEARNDVSRRDSSGNWRSAMPFESRPRQTRGYHYIRYVILGAYLVFFSKTVDWLVEGRIPRLTIGVFGIIVTFMCIIIDVRNYRLYRKELNADGDRPGFPLISLLVLLPFAVLCLFWYSCFLNVPWSYLINQWLPTPPA